jgi:hypothetical protein
MPGTNARKYFSRITLSSNNSKQEPSKENQVREEGGDQNNDICFLTRSAG